MLQLFKEGGGLPKCNQADLVNNVQDVVALFSMPLSSTLENIMLQTYAVSEMSLELDALVFWVSPAS